MRTDMSGLTLWVIRSTYRYMQGYKCKRQTNVGCLWMYCFWEKRFLRVASMRVSISAVHELNLLKTHLCTCQDRGTPLFFLCSFVKLKTQMNSFQSVWNFPDWLFNFLQPLENISLWKTALLTNYKRMQATFYSDHWRRKSLSVTLKTPCGTITKNKN